MPEAQSQCENGLPLFGRRRHYYPPWLSLGLNSAGLLSRDSYPALGSLVLVVLTIVLPLLEVVEGRAAVQLNVQLRLCYSSLQCEDDNTGL